VRCESFRSRACTVCTPAGGIHGASTRSTGTTFCCVWLGPKCAEPRKRTSTSHNTAGRNGLAIMASWEAALGSEAWVRGAEDAAGA
jgi:hypothetical protein